jgi:ubiquinone/menaquinone biosynthesis C-methylase UbiE
MTDLNPNSAAMASTAMVHTLAAQASALWPQEKVLIQRYELPSAPRILDAGCGTGEFTSRLAGLLSYAQLLGVDIIDSALALARSRYAKLAPRLSFEHRSVFELALPDHSFDLTVCRHVLQSIPHADRVIGELLRVTKPGGYLHLIAEDYGMVHFERGGLDLRTFWQVTSDEFGAATAADLYGRHMVGLLAAMHVKDISVDYLVIDTLRVPRPLLAEIFIGWRDTFGEEICARTSNSYEMTRRSFDQMIEQIRDPSRYVVWMVPVISARARTNPGA